MAVDMFIKLDSLKGEAQDADAKHKDTIDVLAWSWGESNSGNAHVGGGAGAGKVNVQDLSFTKHIDLASTSLMEYCANGKHFAKATLTVRKAGDKPLEYLIVEMGEVFISSYSTGGSGGEDRLTENVTLNFAKVKLKYTAQVAGGGKGADNTFGWDISGNAAWA